MLSVKTTRAITVVAKKPQQERRKERIRELKTKTNMKKKPKKGKILAKSNCLEARNDRREKVT